MAMYSEHAAALGQTVKQGHADYCLANGHAFWWVNGELVNICARCDAIMSNVSGTETPTGEWRKGNIFLVVTSDDGDYFWQFSQGARTRVPFATGISDRTATAAMVIKFGGDKIK